MKKILNIFFVFSILCAFLNAKTIRVGISPDYPPFDYINNGKLTGFDHDLVVEIGKILGDDIKFVELNFDGLIAALKMGKIDMIASGMTKTKEREKVCEFSNSYYDSVTYFVKLKTNNEINNLDDLKGKKVSAQLGSIQALLASKIDGIKFEPNPDPIVFVTGTIKGKIDAFAIDSVVAIEYMKKYPELFVFYSTKSGNDSSLSFAFKKGNIELKDRVNNALDELKRNGVYSKLINKYELDEF